MFQVESGSQPLKRRRRRLKALMVIKSRELLRGETLEKLSLVIN